MKRTIFLLAGCLTSTIMGARAASADRPTSVGVGAAAMLGGGPIGAAVTYDAAIWRAEGILEAGDAGRSFFGIGGRFWYVLHSRTNADFSIGGGLGMRHDGRVNANNNDTIHLEMGAQARVFLVENVSINGSVGLGLITGEGDGYLFGGNMVGSLGFTYFFF